MTELAIGIDGGGTSCRAAVADRDGTIIGRGKAGPANILSDLENSLLNIVESARQALIDAGLDAEVVTSVVSVVGVAGANVMDYGQRIERALPFAEGRVVTDALISLQGALGDADGIVGAFGTGSVYNARRGGSMNGIGGWGFIVGDQASGARLGRDLMERSLLAHDRVRPASPVTEAVMAEYGDDPERIVNFAHTARPTDFARYAPMVFRHAAEGDAVAVDIVRNAATAIGESLDALLWPECPSICLLGGLAEAYEPWLSERYKPLLAKPKNDALQGAVELAVKLLNDQQRGEA
ncbi:N-acetylglucosamine kinase [Rhizobium bangladeshense]|uniref:N-acetylglucosamine kinase n=1 Tax=Rhizobium bangladeshense TaxID=1138189 RepID=A0ABS7LBE8_9HYPH|nr:N-acetylglucosamine kinase [Rhizobium bangladeshense]MBX4866784.1 N-acetylglucosamine kinase [Rhizobium bangladeshense]MBX4873986.1 N-acetylglucosamine kinase [Rhizobium bangladeshense]MBX4883499.1 N-acetylglucosamine kinase [Rhizobium bangladeshense]MBX4896807.1 N-acetylglucosamine kinase [Rhizobium bangladeshense]MBY3588780.1 N-acetylglucosamine kinase [Rhizobium bangladeshense]